MDEPMEIPIDINEPGPSAPTDESVLRRKLLMDGEGNGDCKKIDNLLHCFLDWSESTGQSHEDINAGHEKLLSLVAQLEYISKKSSDAQCADATQMKEYCKGVLEMESKIEQVKKIIAERKDKLQAANIYRQNKIKYDALATIVLQQPDRKESESHLREVQKEIDALGSKNEYLRKKFEDKEKQLGALMTSVEELKFKLRAELEEWEDSESD